MSFPPIVFCSLPGCNRHATDCLRWQKVFEVVPRLWYLCAAHASGTMQYFDAQNGRVWYRHHRICAP